MVWRRNHFGLCIKCDNEEYAKHLTELITDQNPHDQSYLTGYHHSNQGIPPSTILDRYYEMGYADGQGDAQVALRLKQQCGPDGGKYWMPFEGQYFEVLWEAIAAKRKVAREYSNLD